VVGEEDDVVDAGHGSLYYWILVDIYYIYLE
jgi:hypothetical protein